MPRSTSSPIGVETRNKDLDMASAQNDSLVRQVLAAARKLAIDASDIQTDFIHVDLKYEHEDSTAVEYYKVTKEIQGRFEIREPGQQRASRWSQSHLRNRIQHLGTS
jgi:uncharacterized protein YggE